MSTKAYSSGASQGPSADPEALQRELQKYRLEHERLQVLLNVTRNITTELELDRLLMRIMDEVRRVLQADRCTVFLVDQEKQELWSKVAHGLEENELRFPISKGLAGYVATTGEVVNIPDCYSDPRFNPEIDRKTGYHTRNLLCSPMRNKLGEIIGVFQVLNKLEGAFNAEDEVMLDAISAIAATQIENAQLYEEQKKTFDSFVETLASTIDARDPLTAGHSQRIMLYSDEIAKMLGFSPSEREVLRKAALLHDFGKIGVREHILCKPGRLTPEEYKHIQSHVILTKTILEKINFHREFKVIPQVASTHHEKLNGKGYPFGLKDDEIPMGGRILAVADVFDALTSKRHYRDRMDFEKVMSILEEGAGVEYDAQVIDCMNKMRLDRLVAIMEDENADKFDAEEIKVLSRHTVGELVQALRQGLENPPDDYIAIFQKYYQRKYTD